MPPPIVAADASTWHPSAAAATAAFPRDALPSRRVAHWVRRFFCFVGPGYLVAVGYMDPGNWATSIAGGSAYGYSLLWIVMLSSLMAMFLQVMCARLGIVTGMDLAQACSRTASRPSAITQWLAAEVAICACDLAEVIGTAIALKLLFGIPLTCGVALTVLDVLTILWLQKRGFRYLEALVISLLGVVLLCFIANLALAQPIWRDVLAGFMPSANTVTEPGMLYIAMGIVGATVMPHNLYLHSSIVKTRDGDIQQLGKEAALKFAAADILIALAIAFFINAAILVTSAAIFHGTGHHGVVQLDDAYKLIGPLTGTTIASVLFALALLASGQSSAVTATLAGQVVMEGYLRWKMPPGLRRLVTRSIAIVPALLVTATWGESAIGKLLLASQLVLSLQLPFAVVPLIRFTASRQLMGVHANGRTVSTIAVMLVATIIGLNAVLIWQALAG